MAKLDEYVEVVHLLLTESGPVDFAGEHYRLDAACLSPRPVQKPRPPIVLGGLAGPKAAAVAARFADEYNLHGTAPADVAPKRARLQAACDALGRDPSTLRLSINGNVLVGTGPDDLALRSRRHAAYQGLVASSPADYLAGLDSSCLVGTPDRLLEQVAAYADAGVGRVLMQVFPHDDYEAISIIGSEIVPAARSMTSRGEPSPGEEGRSDDN
jgi:alkanesulfonate monooxygenase SsuD/methylene tetrahydromethanopterin reductase-like flavin-dependent oxidoreductase (luciferase family)